MSYSETNLIWLDLEMTGLDPSRDKILEMATIVTDAQLNILAEGPVFAVYQPDDVLDNMDEWCINQHGISGLTERCRQSKFSQEHAATETMAFLSKYVPSGISPMCGNSIGQDRRFINAHIPEFEDFFHYRNIDVSTIKELVRRWAPEVANKVVKKGAHLALDDIRDSIEELKVYRAEVFRI